MDAAIAFPELGRTPAEVRNSPVMQTMLEALKAATKRRTAMEILQSSDEEPLTAELDAPHPLVAPAAEPQALLSGVVSASGQEEPEVVFNGC